MGFAPMIDCGFPHLRFLIERQLAVFPAHAPFLEKRFSSLGAESLIFVDGIAEKVMQIAGKQLDRVCEDYCWLSAAVLEEELHFRRSGHYRLSTFEQADREVYSNPEYMTRYMNGLLISQLWWRNHTETLQFFRDEFVAKSPGRATHLEIGPGHGLFLYLAAASSSCAAAEAWDITDSSLAQTRLALEAMHLQREVTLKKVDMFHAPKAQFSSITFSEVLEHLEQPRYALSILRELLTDDGRMFLNAPVNSPAPDHLYLFETPEQLLQMITDAGFAIERTQLSPATGATLERARKHKLTISVSAIVRKR
jgi:2-polyprenyl-3-methyl-5-hydroxy-6-metoxy-1,4-benzoquinol methylase